MFSLKSVGIVLTTIFEVDHHSTTSSAAMREFFIERLGYNDKMKFFKDDTSQMS